MISETGAAESEPIIEPITLNWSGDAQFRWVNVQICAKRARSVEPLSFLASLASHTQVLIIAPDFWASGHQKHLHLCIAWRTEDLKRREQKLWNKKLQGWQIRLIFCILSLPDLEAEAPELTLVRYNMI